MGDWVRRFGFSSDPFSEKTSASFYYGGPYAVASLRLEQALRQRRGYIVVTGDAGVGKTSLVKSVLSRRDVFATASISCAHAQPTAVIEQILVRMEPFANTFSATRRRAALLSMIEQARRSGKPIILIVEDAHLAEGRHLEDLRVALNLDANVEEVVQVLLVGRTRLTQTISSRPLRGLATRVTATVRLSKLTTDEAAEFLHDRLAESGIDEPERVFSRDAIMAIARHCEGVLAKCSALARESLKRAAEANAQVVTPDFVADAATVFAPTISEQERTQYLRPPHRSRWLSAPVGVVTAVVLLAFGVAATQVNLMDPWGAGNDPGAAALDAAALPNPREADKHVEETHAERVAQAKSLRDTFLAGTPYEVQIKPPKRPDALDADQNGEAAKADAAKPAPSVGTQPPGETPANKAAAGSAVVASKPTLSKPVMRTNDVIANGDGSRISLQVAAFRAMQGAVDLKNKLAHDFSDVYISKVISGGEPLYRVRVGNFKSNDDTQSLRTRLQAAGYPSFRVTD
jgi:general secretion pathway protein A